MTTTDDFSLPEHSAIYEDDDKRRRFFFFLPRAGTIELGIEVLDGTAGGLCSCSCGVAQVASFVRRVLALVVVDVGCEGESAQVLPVDR